MPDQTRKALKDPESHKGAAHDDRSKEVDQGLTHYSQQADILMSSERFKNILSNAPDDLSYSMNRWLSQQINEEPWQPGPDHQHPSFVNFNVSTSSRQREEKVQDETLLPIAAGSGGGNEEK